MESIYCAKCRQAVGIPNFSESYKSKITLLLRTQNARAQVVLLIKNNSSLDLREAKLLTYHITTEYNKCVRCNNNSLFGEHVICPQCKALNINWPDKPFEL